MAAKKPSIIPMVILSILAFLNIIAAGVLFYYAGAVWYTRVQWVRALEERQRLRDGLSTDQLIAQLTPDQKESLKKWEAEYTRRKTAASLQLSELKEKPDQIGNQESQKAAREYGPADYRRVLNEFIKLRTPELRGEEQRLAEEKNTLLQIGRQYDARIARLREEISRFVTDEGRPEEMLAKERDILERLNVENQARRLELASLYAELEEAVAARELAEGTLADFKRRRDAIREKASVLVAENLELEQEIKRLEQAKAQGSADSE